MCFVLFRMPFTMTLGCCRVIRSPHIATMAKTSQDSLQINGKPPKNR